MSHFAKIEDGLVTQVIVADKDFIDSGLVGDPGKWVQTSYNTKGGIHYGDDGKPDGGEALRSNFACVGGRYDSTNDVFYPPQPYPSWTISAPSWQWKPPVEYPQDGLGIYEWNEDKLTWVLLDDNLS